MGSTCRLLHLFAIPSLQLILEHKQQKCNHLAEIIFLVRDASESYEQMAIPVLYLCKDPLK